MATVRAATEEDIPRILELYDDLSLSANFGKIEQSYPSPNEVQKVVDAISAMTGYELLVAEEDGTVVGTMVLLIVPNLSHRALPWATVENVIVDNRYRRRGIGRILMDYAIDRARQAGCYKIQLISNKKRLEAHNFYQEMGFETSVYGFRLYL
jgi:L-amino acid N-acyltransferase YncA